jgi:hypothetical protein
MNQTEDVFVVQIVIRAKKAKMVDKSLPTALIRNDDFDGDTTGLHDSHERYAPEILL